jgi:hypothetical protein
MEKKDNGWRIQSTELPKWILQNEGRLNEAIEDELKNW